MSYEPKEHPQNATPAAYPVPDYTPQPQVYQNVQPQQPILVYTVPSTLAPPPATCCMCIPLKAGAMIIAFLMTIYYGYCGIPLLLVAPRLLDYDHIAGVIAIVFGVLYVSIATVSIFGFVGILCERLDWVSRFVRLYFIGCCIWLAVEITGVILAATGMNSTNGADVFVQTDITVWIIWVAIMVVALAFQYYFWRALVSYERLLTQQHQGFDGAVPAGGARVANDIALV
ncbi:hypothetical protein BG006_001864 [Podila minutissima]|uniref:Uncharacterized protein n=1 Tax=Podila minutissima TaxID=64525 RepID=A0A9P5SSX6_9FUNG|nr:hypothetical protein BG006_001864 [Podila minutissima]